MWVDPDSGRSKLIGITSTSFAWVDENNPEICPEGHPTVYARVTAVLDWIKEVIHQ